MHIWYIFFFWFKEGGTTAHDANESIFEIEKPAAEIRKTIVAGLFPPQVDDGCVPEQHLMVYTYHAIHTHT